MEFIPKEAEGNSSFFSTLNDELMKCSCRRNLSEHYLFLSGWEFETYHWLIWLILLVRWGFNEELLHNITAGNGGCLILLRLIYLDLVRVHQKEVFVVRGAAVAHKVYGWLELTILSFS